MDIKKVNSNNTIILEKEKKHGFWRFFLFSLYIMVLGAFGAVLADRIIFPHMAQMDFFKNSHFLKRAIENTTIINKTEQIVVPGDFLGQKIFEEGRSAAVEIIKNPESRIPNPETVARKKETIETEEAGNQKLEIIGLGFAVTQDGIVFCPNFLADSTGSEENKFSIKNFQGEEREAELLADKSDDNILVLRYSGDRMNIPVLAFADSVKAGEEAAAVSQSSVITAFIKSVSENQILLNDYPDAAMSGAIVLNKDGKIAGLYHAGTDKSGRIVSSVIPAGILKSKIGDVLK